MKKLITLLFVCLLQTSFATTFYVSNSGNDANNGTSEGAAWKTLAKVNSQTFTAGDRILFKRGDVFYGGITVNQSGTLGNPITFGAYGTGAKPIITGLTNVTSWTNLGGNIWESASAVSTLVYTKMVVINNKSTPMGRYPNTGYLTFQSYSGSSSITSSSLTGTPNWTGAEVVMKKIRYLIDVGTITSQSGGTLQYSSPNNATPENGNGFFIQNDARTLDAQNEWYYNPTTKKLRVYSSSMPTDVKITTIEKLLTHSGTINYVTIQDIAFIGANYNAIELWSGTGKIINNCDIKYSGLHGVYTSGTSYPTISNNDIRYSNGNAIRLSGGTTYGSIISNTIKVSGMIEGMMVGIEGNWSMGAIAATSNNVLVQYNNIDSSGYNGIWAGGINMKLRNNFINYSCLKEDDGGGIYVSGGGGTDTPGKEITDNIILNTQGNLEGVTGSNDPLGVGIYLDSWSEGVIVKGNTVANGRAAGFFLENSYDCLIRDNTFYNNSDFPTGFLSQAEFHLQYISHAPIRNLKIYNNIFFAKRADKLPYYYYSIANDITQFGLADSNYFVKPIGGTLITTQVSSSIVNRTLTQWQIYTGQDIHSKVTPESVSPSSDVRFEYNATNSPQIVSLGSRYIDVRGNVYNGTITLQPWASAILMIPTVFAGENQTICAGTSVTLTADNPDGAVISWNHSVNDGVPFAPSTTQTYIVTADLNGAIYTDSVTITVEGCSGLTENEINSVTIAPNPASDYIKVNVGENNSIDAVQIISLEGQTVAVNMSKIDSHTTKINVSSVAKGTYFIRLTTEKGQMVKKIVVQ